MTMIRTGTGTRPDYYSNPIYTSSADTYSIKTDFFEMNQDRVSINLVAQKKGSIRRYQITLAEDDWFFSEEEDKKITDNFDVNIMDIKKMLAKLGMDDDYDVDLSSMVDFIKKCEQHNYEINVEVIYYENEIVEAEEA